MSQQQYCELLIELAKIKQITIEEAAKIVINAVKTFNGEK